MALPLLNTQGAYQLLADIRAARGKDIEIDASQVRHLGAQAVQILVSAKQSWGAAKNTFSILQPSLEFRQSVDALGGTDLLDVETAAP